VRISASLSTTLLALVSMALIPLAHIAIQLDVSFICGVVSVPKGTALSTIEAKNSLTRRCSGSPCQATQFSLIFNIESV
jgi:hypothetical protein